MEIYERLYVGESVNNPDKVIHKLRKGARFTQEYVIILARTSDQLEIHQAGYLTQKYYRQNPPFVIGIAGTHEEAVELIMKIAQESYTARGDCDLKQYLAQI